MDLALSRSCDLISNTTIQCFLRSSYHFVIASIEVHFQTKVSTFTTFIKRMRLINHVFAQEGSACLINNMHLITSMPQNWVSSIECLFWQMWPQDRKWLDWQS